jgi:D-alanyl-D-alanine carboxypeptidase
MRKPWTALFGLILLAVSPHALADPATDKALAAKADALIQPNVRDDQFSGTVLVARNGTPIFRHAYGLANREWSIPNSMNTKFRIGSITKQFTATAILQLQEAGKLSVDDPVSKYYVDAPAAWKDITIRHLLTHTSGIPTYTSMPKFFDGQARLDRTPEEIIKLTQDQPLEFQPGTKFSYDNSGYILLGYIIEKVSGEHYADYLQHHIFDPLGMKDTGYDLSEKIIPHRASGYGFNEKQNKHFNSQYISMTEPFSAGSLYSTVDDMLIWDQALYAGKLLSPSSYDAMFKDYGHGYGFGWFVDNEFGHQHIYHPGGINGFLSLFDRYPKDKLTIVVFSNEENASPGRIAAGLAALYLGIPPRTAAKGGEALLKQTIESLQHGTPNYDQMSPGVVAATRTQLPDLQKTIGELGDVESIGLISADVDGTDRYKVSFQKGAEEWDIHLDKEGKIASVSFHAVGAQGAR